MNIETVLRKLEPLLSEKVKRWRSLLPAVEEETRRLLERRIMMTAQRMLGDMTSQILLPPPPERLARGELHLGQVLYHTRSWPFGLRCGELVQHLVVFGRSGAGKTNIVFQLLLELEQAKVPFLFLDWKRTCRHLVPLLRNKVAVFTPGRTLAPLRFSPLVPPPGMETLTYAGLLTDLLARAYALGEGAKSLVQRALMASYTAGSRWPRLEEVRGHLDGAASTGRTGLWKTSALRALDSLTVAQLFDDQDHDQETLVRQLFQQNTVIELDGLSASAKLFLVPTVLLWLYQCKLQEPAREHLDLVVVIEEAHHLLYRQEHRAQEAVTERLLRQCRELGVGVVIVDQHPHLISSAALGNAYASIVLNLKDPADLSRAAGLSMLSEDEKHYLTMLPVGQAIVKLQDRWRYPFLVRFPLVKVEKGSMTDQRLRAWLARQAPGSGLKRVVERADEQVRQGRAEDEGLDEDACAFIMDVSQHGGGGVKERYRRLEWSVDKGNRMKRYLVQLGLLEEATVNLRTTRKVVLRPTMEARRKLGLDKLGSGKASLEHEYWKNWMAEQYRAMGYQVEVEAPRRSGRVDVLATKGQERIAIEIETGKSDVVGNVLGDLRSGVTGLVVVATDERALAKVERELAKAGLLIPGRVTVELAASRSRGSRLLKGKHEEGQG